MSGCAPFLTRHAKFLAECPDEAHGAVSEPWHFPIHHMSHPHARVVKFSALVVTDG